MANIKISGQQGGILRQEVATGKFFAGLRTSHVAGIDQPTVIRSSILQFDRNPNDGEGLFEFAPFISNVRGQVPIVFVSWVKIIVGGVVPWDIYVTDGDGAAGVSVVDTLVLDAPIATGTGNASVRVMRDFAPGSRLRFISTAVSSPFGVVEVEVHPIEELTRPWN